jgi:DNA-binding SARP family transcriptional activator
MANPQRTTWNEHNPRTSSSGISEVVRVRMLGGFSVSVGGKTIEESEWRLKKAAGLVKLLALAPEHRMHCEQLMDLLWPDLDKKAQANNLRYALHIARRALGLVSHTDIPSRLLPLRGELLQIGAESPLWVDVEAFEEAARSARRSQEVGAYRAAVDLYAGELLPQDSYEAWAEDRREELRRTHLSLLLELAALYEQHEEYDAAAGALQKALASESTHEEAHTHLMRLYALSRRRGEALEQYEHLREVLKREYATEPSAESRRLHEEIKAGTFPPVRLPRQEEERPKEEPQEEDSRRHNLPVALTSFIGREQELLEIKRELAMTRLLTLMGSGGSGKTRLALEVARDLVGAYPDGAWFVSWRR